MQVSGYILVPWWEANRIFIRWKSHYESHLSMSHIIDPIHILCSATKNNLTIFSLFLVESIFFENIL